MMVSAARSVNPILPRLSALWKAITGWRFKTVSAEIAASNGPMNIL